MSSGVHPADVSTVIVAEDLGRWYGEVIGLGDLSVTIPRGVTGLVGPNGAGKSTFMKLIVGELRPGRGTLSVLGLKPFANRELYKKLGFAPQQDALYDHMTGRAFVRELVRIAGYPKADADARAVHALERLQLHASMDRPCGGYSKGMRQRVRIAQAIAHEPELLIADEPLTGLDPLARHVVLDLFRELSAGGTSIIVSSHVLHELEALTDRMVLIHRGRLLAQGAVRDVRKLLSRHPSKLHITARDPRRLAKALVALDYVESVRIGSPPGNAASPSEGTLDIETRDLAAFQAEFPALAARERAGVRSLESGDASLEAVFDYLVN
ncbi:MAG: ABC transporter ATP-binding protein [Planctomycetota bacterium]